MGDTKIIGAAGDLKYPDGVIAGVPDRVGNQGELYIGQLHGERYEAALRGTVFYAANQAVVTTTIALATTYTGLLLYNPVGNYKKFSIIAVSAKFVTAQAAASMFYLSGGYTSTGGVTAHTTPIAWGSGFGALALGLAATSTGLIDAAATIVSPKRLIALGGSFTAGAFGADTPSIVPTYGVPILYPGAYVFIETLTVAGIVGSIWWEEIAL